MNLKDKKVVVIGFGRSGQAAASLLLNLGAKVLVLDTRPKEDLPQKFVKDLEAQGVVFHTGPHDPRLISSGDLVVVSPGVSPKVYASALEAGLPVLGELELAYRCLNPGKKIIAVTGTNGKTTTTAMIADIFRLCGRRVFVGANFGTPLSEFVLTHQQAEILVLEVSSFQLETITRFSPDIALLLNITPDHLERYKDFEEYAYTKFQLFFHQKRGQKAIIGEEIPVRQDLISQIPGDLYFLGIQEGAHAFLRENSFELFLDVERQTPPEVYSFTGFKLLGFHNRMNFVGAALASRLLGASPQAIKEAIKNFVGFPHRLEFIGCFGGVYFVNDSKATNVDATLKALEGLVEPIILILGGKHKGGSYLPLARMIREKVKTLILMGESRYIMAEELGNLTYTKIVPSLEEAINVAFSKASPGDTVLLSPAAASFDQFENYQERGDFFKEIVTAYAPELLGKERFPQVVYH